MLYGVVLSTRERVFTKFFLGVSADILLGLCLACVFSTTVNLMWFSMFADIARFSAVSHQTLADPTGADRTVPGELCHQGNGTGLQQSAR